VLDGPNGPDYKGMLKIATDYYKNLLKKEGRPNITLVNDFFSPEEKVNDEANSILENSFT
jgi:hypothetical protein